MGMATLPPSFPPTLKRHFVTYISVNTGWYRNMNNTVAKQKCHVSHLNFKFMLSFLHFYVKCSILLLKSCGWLFLWNRIWCLGWCGLVWAIWAIWAVETKFLYFYNYCKVTSSNTSRLEAHAGFFRLLLKRIFDPYVLWPFD